jgi:hypothetical protein
MAAEKRRGCGYRKVGGKYLVSGGEGIACCKLPIELHVCPTCAQGVKQGRGWQWIDPRPWLQGACRRPDMAPFCPAATSVGERVGLLWIGEKFYPTAEDFSREAREMGISRRIRTVPRGFKVGEHYVFLAHPKGFHKYSDNAAGSGLAGVEWVPGIFYIFKPTAIEIIITQSQSDDVEFMADLDKQGLTPVVVPDDDKDHQGSVFDDEQDILPLEQANGNEARQ